MALVVVGSAMVGGATRPAPPLRHASLPQRSRVRPSRPVPPGGVRTVAMGTANEYKEAGRRFSPENVTVKRGLGEGSFGQVFEGMLCDGGEDHRVVLKRVKPRVEGAQQMVEMEHMLNIHVSANAKGACANFLGYMNVSPKEASGRISQGLWLMWEFQGSKTLAYYLRHRSGLQQLADDLGVTVDSVVPTAMHQLLGCLRSLHNAGVVHRDIKPLNIVVDEEARALKLIDLGAAADLRTGMNYVPDESILDPNYCAPEQFVLPTTSVDLAEQALPVALVVSPMLWAKYQPDRFDIYSAGLVMMQLALPQLRSQRGLSTFATELQRAEYDLMAWRSSKRLRNTEYLDANGEAGWKLATAMLRQRVVEAYEGDETPVKRGAQRPSAAQCLKHPFLRDANQLAASETNSWHKGFDVWKTVTSKLFDLEASIVGQESATATQKGTVKKLAKAVESGKVDEAVLTMEKEKLGQMEAKLESDVARFDQITAGASKWLSRFLGGDRAKAPQAPEAAKEAEEQAAAAAAAARAEVRKEEVARPATSGRAQFGHLAATFAERMAAGLREDAERRAARLEAEAAQKKALAAASAAFLVSLKELEPPLLPDETDWPAVQARLTLDEEGSKVLSPERQQRLFRSFIGALKRDEEERKEEEERARKAEEARLTLEEQMRQEARRRALDDELREKEQRLLLAAKVQRLAQREEEEIALQREVDFRKMLDELTDPPLCSKTPWVVVQRRVWSDRRFVAVLGAGRREQLFNEYMQVLAEYEEAVAQQGGGAPAPEASELVAPAGPRPGVAPVEESLEDALGREMYAELATLEQLQSTMQQDYQSLEQKLAEIERSLLMKEAVAMEVVQEKLKASKDKDVDAKEDILAAADEKEEGAAEEEREEGGVPAAEEVFELTEANRKQLEELGLDTERMGFGMNGSPVNGARK